MARITTIDCARLVPNRFELVLLAVARARALHRGDKTRMTAWPMARWAPPHQPAAPVVEKARPARAIAPGPSFLDRSDPPPGR